MATPNRSGFGDFDMSSARKPDAAGYGGDYHSSSQHHGGGNQSVSEQRFAKLVAEAELKLIEEKSRAHEREAKLKEELARERANIPRMVNERVEQALRERGGGGKGGAGGGDGSGGSNSVENAQLRQQLAETQKLLNDMERRYQQEKRELLAVRTAQLKNETSKRGQEGDIIARAMQVMSEYETIVRSSEENSLSRLAHHMETFEAEWVRRSKDFEERKAEFEALVMTKALGALKEHNNDVESIGEAVLNRTMALISGQSQSRLDIERNVLEQSEAFKAQYKDLLDEEFRERCRVYDDRVAERERNLIQIVQQERDRIIEAEAEAVKKAEETHVHALASAMREVSDLREQLVKEHHQQQQRALEDLVAKRQEMQADQDRILVDANGRVKDIELRCMEAVEAAQASLKDMQLELASKEADCARRVADVETHSERNRVSELAKVREDVEAQWRETIEAVRAEHVKEVESMKADNQDRLEREHTEQFTREQELRKSFEAKLKRAEDGAEARWQKRLTESNRGLERHLEVIEALRDDNEQLNHQVSTLQQQVALRENEFSSKISTVQREHEQLWHRKLEEMRQRYDQLLDEALGGPQGDTVTRLEHEKVLENLRELEERCVEMKKTEGQRLAQERAQLNDMWRARLEQERSERAEWEEEQLKRLSELRIEMDADMRRKETEMVRRAEQERMKLHDEALRRGAEERRDREEYECKLREDFALRVREAEEELNEAYRDKVAVLDRRVDEKELAVEKQRANLKSEMMAFEEQSKAQALEWLEREKESILADVKKFHEKLTKEQERMEEERSLFEQQVALKYADLYERAKSDLQKKMLDVTNIHTSYWQRCEQEWLDFRAEETAMLYRLRSEHESRMFDFAKTAADNAQRMANETLRKEQELLDEKEARLYKEVESERLAQEAASRERALRLLDERNKIQEEAERLRSQEEAKLWEDLEKKVLEKEQQAEADRRILELDLRTRYEAMISAERQRVDAMMETHRKEARSLYEKHEESIREREEQWHRQRLAIEMEEKSSHERQYHELRSQCENRVYEERKRFESTLKMREAEFEQERSRIFDNLETQFKDHESALRSQVTTLKEDYEQRIKNLILENQSQREQQLMDVAEQERRFQSTRDEYEADSGKRFDRAMTELRGQIDKRVKEQQTRELEQRETLEKSRRDYEERINGQYEHLLKEHEERLFAIQREREDKVADLEGEHQKHLLAVRADMDRTLSTYFATADARARETAEQVRVQFQQRLDEFNKLLAEERQARHGAEDRLSEVRDEMEALRSSVEQHKLELHRNVQHKYEKMYSELRDKLRREKEDLARRQLEEEEKRLAKELLKNQPENQHGLSAGIRNDVSRTWGGGGGSGGGSGGASQQQHGTPSTAGASRHVDTSAAFGRSDTRDSMRDDDHHHHSSRVGDVTEADRVTLEMVKKRMGKLEQLWQVLDLPGPKRDDFNAALRREAPSKQLDTVNQEVKRLELQLPLLETITQREYVQHRIQEEERAARKDPHAQQSLQQVRADLARLTEQLKVDVPRHEQRFGARFLYRGVPYLDTLLSESDPAVDPNLRTPASNN